MGSSKINLGPMKNEKNKFEKITVLINKKSDSPLATIKN